MAGIHLTQDDEEKEEVKEKLTKKLTTFTKTKIIPFTSITQKNTAEEKKINEMQSNDGVNDAK